MLPLKGLLTFLQYLGCVCFWVKNIYKKYFTPNRMFGWIGKYGQTKINFNLIMK